MEQDDTAHTDARLRRAMDQVKQRGSRLRDFRTWPLFGVILVWVVLALVVFTVLGWVWGEGAWWSSRWLTNWRSAGAGASPLDIVKVSLTTIGGIGGTGYLVIKYRERASAERAEKAAELARKDVEQEKAEQRLLSAVQQLGSQSPQVRIAGVYSLADVADTYRGPYKQRVVDILCGYLRSNRGQWEKPSEAADDSDKPSARTYVSDDGAVESTVLAVLRRHLRAGREATGSGQEVVQEVEDDQLWCDCAIDLHGAVLTERLNFDRTTFKNTTDFSGATFTQDSNFRNTTFTLYVSFSGATFTQDATFWGAVFSQYASFRGATFTQYANFMGASFAQSYFREVAFGKNANFWGATFTQYANFMGASFTQSANFTSANFTQDANYRRTVFNFAVRQSYIFPDYLPLDAKTGLPPAPGGLVSVRTGPSWRSSRTTALHLKRQQTLPTRSRHPPSLALRSADRPGHSSGAVVAPAVVAGREAEHGAEVGGQVRLVGVAQVGSDLGDRQPGLAPQTLRRLLEPVAADDGQGRKTDEPLRHPLDAAHRGTQALGDLLDPDDRAISGDEILHVIGHERGAAGRSAVLGHPGDEERRRPLPALLRIRVLHGRDDPAVQVSIHHREAAATDRGRRGSQATEGCRTQKRPHRPPAAFQHTC